MLVPVRCFTCGNLIADKFEDYQNKVRSGEDAAKVLDSLGVKRYCCRRMLMSHVNVIDTLLQYPSAPGQKAVFRKDEQ